ncbi:MAG TPA: hypothetical protein VFZ85_16405 [Jiangellaceae bacterium]
MSYSGLIYAAIVACWASVLVPRWIRRNEEVERAREEDAARGVRVLERRQAHSRRAPTHSMLPASSVPSLPDPAVGRSNATPDASGYGSYTDDVEPEEGHDPAADYEADLHEFYLASFAVAARRRRRVLTLLVLALGVVALAMAAGRLPTVAIAVPAVLLSAFFVLARRAAVVQARRLDRLRRAARRRAQARAQAEAEEESASAEAMSSSGKRIAVLDLPEPAEPPDPNAWQPVPVPLPTYLTKAKAETPAVRRIDLSSPGAWTSGRLNPAGSIALPPARPAEDGDLPEQWRAVGG